MSKIFTNTKINLFLFKHFHVGLPEEAQSSRLRAIVDEIAATGTYELTFDELQHGAKVSWRNAPKCANRAKWNELTVKDCRDVKTNEEAFDRILELLDESITSGATITRMAVFPQKKPNDKQGARIWNMMLLRFAGYSERFGILGDPADAEFTTTLIERFGWTPPNPRTAWDPLPLLLQIDEESAPRLFSLPSQYVPIVPIRHPEMPRLNELELKWFGVPIVSGLLMTIGGLTFSMCPFVGWFMVSNDIFFY